VSKQQFHRRALKKYLFLLFEKEGKIIDRIDIIFCTDNFLLTLNKRYLNHNWFTDTLTFLLSSPKEPLVGEIYISVDRVKFNSKELSAAYKTELIRVIIHGCLHLCGYSDKSKSQARNMENLQENYLKNWGCFT
jgi:rRNA maturation RNase YbeY